MWLYFLGFFVHFILILSAVDIFFQNYLSSGEWKCNNRTGVAKRLVFILADGLDQHQLEREATGRVAAAVNGRGSWGNIVGPGIPSHYAGLQALLTGFAVDPLTTYFTRFILEEEALDNFINRSQSVFYFGTKDDYEYIYKGSKEWWTYFHPDWESSIVSNVSFSELGNMTTGRLQHLFSSSQWNDTLKESLDKSQTTFFIQFNFVARTGQMFGFDSNITSLAVNSLFSAIDNLVSLTEEYYNKDNKTVYIICSNYRQEDGYQGATWHRREWNRNLFVTWGPGIASNQDKVVIRQSQVAPLASALLGLDLPKNSRGLIPVSITNFSLEDMAQAQVCNAVHLYNLAIASESSVPFNMSYHNYSSEYINTKLQDYVTYKKYHELENLIKVLTNVSLRKLYFNESVYRSAVWYCALFTSLSWILLICSEVLPCRDTLDNKSLISFSELKVRVTSRLNNINNHMRSAMRKKKFDKNVRNDDSSANHEINVQEASFSQQPVQEEANGTPELSTSNAIQIENNRRRRSLITWKWLRGLSDILFFLSISMAFVLIFFLEWSPLFIYYMVMPIILLWLFSYTLVDWVIFAKEHFLSSWKEISIYSIIFLLTDCLIIRGCNHGIILQFGVILILQSLIYIQKSSWSITTTWLTSGCLILVLADKGLWTSSPPVEWALVSSIIVLIMWNLYATFRLIPKGIDFAVTVALLWQDGMSLGCVLFTDAILSAGHETPCMLKVLCWSSFLFTLLPAIHRKDPSALVLNICMALSIPFILLSTAFEPLFFLLISNFMISWMILEGYSDEGKVKRQLNGDDARRAVLFVYFCFVCNNVLDINHSLVSANIYSIRCFTVTLIDPIVWFLLAMKPLIIYILLIVIYLIICLSNGVRIAQGFNLVLLIFEIISSTLFFQIHVNEKGDMSRYSLFAVIQYFTLNILITIMLAIVLICKYIYRLPMSKAE